MSNLQLHIPEYLHPALKQLMALSESDSERLVAALTEEKPAFLSTGLAAQVAERSQLDPVLVSRLTDALTSVRSVWDSTHVPLEAFLGVFCAALEQQGLKPQDDATWDRFQRTLGILLSHEGALAAASKALSVVADLRSIFQDARILTDLRPVFRQDATERPFSFAIIHTLRITFHHEGHNRRFFVALDDHDVLRLRRILERAEEKSQTLRSLADSANMPILKIEPQEGPW